MSRRAVEERINKCLALHEGRLSDRDYNEIKRVAEQYGINERILRHEIVIPCVNAFNHEYWKVSRRDNLEKLKKYLDQNFTESTIDTDQLDEIILHAYDLDIPRSIVLEALRSSYEIPEYTSVPRSTLYAGQPDLPNGFRAAMLSSDKRSDSLFRIKPSNISGLAEYELVSDGEAILEALSDPSTFLARCCTYPDTDPRIDTVITINEGKLRLRDGVWEILEKAKLGWQKATVSPSSQEEYELTPSRPELLKMVGTLLASGLNNEEIFERVATITNGTVEEATILGCIVEIQHKLEKTKPHDERSIPAPEAPKKPVGHRQTPTTKPEAPIVEERKKKRKSRVLPILGSVLLAVIVVVGISYVVLDNLGRIESSNAAPAQEKQEELSESLDLGNLENETPIEIPKSEPTTPNVASTNGMSLAQMRNRASRLYSLFEDYDWDGATRFFTASVEYNSELITSDQMPHELQYLYEDQYDSVELTPHGFKEMQGQNQIMFEVDEHLRNGDQLIDTTVQIIMAFDNSGIVTQYSRSAVPEQDEIIYSIYDVDPTPQFPGGEAQLTKYLAENVRYPRDAYNAGLIGTIYVEFEINKLGEVQNQRIVNGMSPGCNEEALRVVSTMPNWSPGMRENAAVIVKRNLPINFNNNTKGPRDDAWTKMEKYQPGTEDIRSFIGNWCEDNGLECPLMDPSKGRSFKVYKDRKPFFVTGDFDGDELKDDYALKLQPKGRANRSILLIVLINNGILDFKKSSPIGKTDYIRVLIKESTLIDGVPLEHDGIGSGIFNGKETKFQYRKGSNFLEVL